MSGSVPGRRRAARVQAAKAARAQVDHPPLLALQGGVGLDRPASRHLHRNLHALRGRFLAERGTAGQRRPHRHHRPHRRRHVHNRHTH